MNKTAAWIGGVVAALLIGASVGAVSNEKAEPTPVVTTVTATVTAEPTGVTEACSSALSDADELLSASRDVISIMAEIMDLSPKAIEAAFYRDTEGMVAVTKKITAKNGKLSKITEEIEGLGETYRTAREECLAGG